ncbi:site-specific DNA-methyltransferase [Chachezhania sediminis]|uniref:site-specific DNA-methyltransferase n=1 Tax=Chachezhania sediminis TaxID=2599291 RepID=UPI00131CF137|nr:site-specific DNA-methyltransferase [Chachezhania sediminis]
MPTLNWIGKDAVEHHHAEVPYRLVHCDGDLSAGDPDAGNLLVQGDNLEALKALLPYYGGQVKCIYIDPPYNTGNEGWVYNDNVASPEIKAWLGKVVGKEADDLSRHDKWLCMMYPRLRLLREFLRTDGVIFVSMDDSEGGTARMLLDEIFGRRNHLATVIWQKVFSPKNSARFFSDDHEYIFVYAKSLEKCELRLLERGSDQDARYKNPDNDPRGPWTSGDLSARNYYGEGTYPIQTPSGRVISGPPTGMYWRVSKAKFDELDADSRLWWGERGDNVPRLKRFLSEVKQGVVPQTLWFHKDVGNTQEAKKELLEAVSFADSQSVFITPKPTRLVKRIVQIASGPNDLILDSFAGSGTTGQAILDLNRQDAGNRRFILVEMDKKIAPEITAERLRRVICGYDKGGDAENPVEGLGGGFRYCRLGVPLFNEFGDIDSAVNFPDLAAHIFFAETGVPIPSKADGGSPYLGKHGEKVVYLLFAPGQEGTPRESMGNVLTPDALANLPAPPDGFEGSRVVYAEGCTVAPDRLKSEGVVFKQIPYQVEGV